MRNANGYGSVIKLAGNRRKPWACRKTVGFTCNEETKKSYPIYKYISYHATRKEAVQALAEYNKSPYQLNNYSFRDVYLMWDEHVDKSDQMHTKYKNAFNKISYLHSMEISKITLKDLQYCFDNVKLTKDILKHVRILIKNVFEYAAKREMIPMSSLQMLDLVEMVARKESRKVTRKPFSKYEIDWLWSHQEDNQTAKQILMYIYTGMRFKELQTVLDEDIHSNYIELKKSKTEAGARIVPLSDKALSLQPMERIPDYYDFYYRFNELMGLLGTTHTIHDCRHTFVSLMTEAGTDPRLLKKIVGHASDDVTEDVYTHYSLEVMLEAVNKI